MIVSDVECTESLCLLILMAYAPFYSLLPLPFPLYHMFITKNFTSVVIDHGLCCQNRFSHGLGVLNLVCNLGGKISKEIFSL